MKIRNGFVSNSSSSSFVIVGRKITLEDIDLVGLKKKKFKYIANTGLSYEGDVFVNIENEKMLNLLKRADAGEFGRMDGHVEVYESYLDVGEGSSAMYKREDLPEKFQVFSFIEDQSGYCDVKQLEQMYTDDY